MLSVLIRAVAYASLFIGVVLVYLPAQTLSRAGIERPRDLGPAQVVGVVAVLVGAALAGASLFYEAVALAAYAAGFALLMHVFVVLRRISNNASS